MPIADATAPRPVNEPVKSYEPGSRERAALKSALEDAAKSKVELPLFIGGRDVETASSLPMRSPHDHELELGRFSQGDASHVNAAIEAALTARAGWAALSQNERSSVFLKAAELAATSFRYRLNAATMLGQSKTAYQAEIDSACELID
ncbi:MAG: aldehyde dehydrogenase family protein, partial [Myxococcales bacterium]|nr:aldehyde dehydrogenase family protein [Myxococcales bacterium]